MDSSPQRPYHVTKSKGADKSTLWERRTRRRKIGYIVAAAIIVIGLAVGLGVGLTIGRRRRGGESESTPKSIWQPAVGASWQIMLKNPPALDESASVVTPDVDVYDIDLFDSDEAVISALKQLDKRVICYFSAGSFEDWRPDKDSFKSDDLGNDLDGWPGEKWLDVRSDNVRSIMSSRIQMAAEKGCDAIDPDNTDGYENDNGVGQTEEDSIDYIKFLSKAAADNMLAIGLKNSGAIVNSVLDDVQFSVNEQCVQFSECTTYAPFVRASKPVFHIEYPEDAPEVEANQRSELCSATGDAEGSDRFSTVIKKMELDGWVQYCDGDIADTAA